MPDRSDGSPVPTGGLAAPARRALAGAGYATLEDLVAVPGTRVADLQGVGPDAIETLREALEAHGLSFREGDRRKEGEATTWR